jgi:DnaJ-class molecular chaperone
MADSKKKNKVICPVCKGNGFVRIPYKLAKEEQHAQCGICESEGEINADEVDNIYIDSDGIHSLH